MAWTVRIRAQKLRQADARLIQVSFSGVLGLLLEEWDREERGKGRISTQSVLDKMIKFPTMLRTDGVEWNNIRSSILANTICTRSEKLQCSSVSVSQFRTQDTGTEPSGGRAKRGQGDPRLLTEDGPRCTHRHEHHYKFPPMPDNNGCGRYCHLGFI